MKITLLYSNKLYSLVYTFISFITNNIDRILCSKNKHFSDCTHSTTQSQSNTYIYLYHSGSVYSIPGLGFPSPCIYNSKINPEQVWTMESCLFLEIIFSFAIVQPDILSPPYLHIQKNKETRSYTNYCRINKGENGRINHVTLEKSRFHPFGFR